MNLLTDQDKNLLKLIYLYGGYVKIAFLDYLYGNITFKYKYKKLNKLYEMGYLTARRLKSNSKREALIYQITQPTCKIFLNPNSYFRKKHKEEYITRALLKSCFCFEIHNELQENILADQTDRVNIFLENNFNKDFFPKKYNKDCSFVHFEELQLDFTKLKGNKLINDNEILYTDSVKKIIIVYIDKFYIDIKSQIALLINRYMNLMKNNKEVLINFLVVVDNEGRKKFYENEIKNFISSRIKSFCVSDNLVELYAKYFYVHYKNIAGYEKELVKLQNDYDNGNLKKQIVNDLIFKDNDIENKKMLSEKYKKMSEEINLERENYIYKKVNELIKFNGNRVKAEDDIINFFDELFLLEYKKYINLDKNNDRNFEIKVYKINQKICY